MAGISTSARAELGVATSTSTTSRTPIVVQRQAEVIVPEDTILARRGFRGRVLGDERRSPPFQALELGLQGLAPGMGLEPGREHGERVVPAALAHDGQEGEGSARLRL
jgi:hypothetical protein